MSGTGLGRVKTQTPIPVAQKVNREGRADESDFFNNLSQEAKFAVRAAATIWHIAMPVGEAGPGINSRRASARHLS